MQGTQNGVMTYKVKSVTEVKEDSKSKFPLATDSSILDMNACLEESVLC